MDNHARERPIRSATAETVTPRLVNSARKSAFVLIARVIGPPHRSCDDRLQRGLTDVKQWVYHAAMHEGAEQTLRACVMHCTRRTLGARTGNKEGQRRVNGLARGKE